MSCSACYWNLNKSLCTCNGFNPQSDTAGQAVRPTVTEYQWVKSEPVEIDWAARDVVNSKGEILSKGTKTAEAEILKLGAERAKALGLPQDGGTWYVCAEVHKLLGSAEVLKDNEGGDLLALELPKAPDTPESLLREFVMGFTTGILDLKELSGHAKKLVAALGERK